MVEPRVLEASVPKRVQEALPIPEPTKAKVRPTIEGGERVGTEIEFELPEGPVLQPSQLFRPLGVAAGFGLEAGRLGVEAVAQTAEAVQSVVSPDVPLSRRSAEYYRKQLADLTGDDPEIFDPQVSKRLAAQLAGEQTIAEQKDIQTSTYAKAKQDAADAIAGGVVFLLRDIIPLLPAPNKMTVAQQIEEAMEVGAGIPMGTAGFAPILMKATDQALDGDLDSAVDTLASRPATLALTLLPYAPAITKRSPKLATWVKETVRSKIPKRVKEGVATAKRYIDDPVVQSTPEATARAETIFEEARAAEQRAGEAFDILTESVKEPRPLEADVETSITTGVTTSPKTVKKVYNINEEGITSQRVRLGAGEAEPSLIYEIPNETVKKANAILEKDSFLPELGDIVSPEKITEASKKVRKSVEDAVVRTLDETVNIFLQEPTTRKGVAKRLARDVGRPKQKDTIAAIEQVLLDMTEKELAGVNKEIRIGGETLTKQNIRQAVIQEKGLSSDILAKEAARRGKLAVETEAFNSRLRSGIDADTIDADTIFEEVRAAQEAAIEAADAAADAKAQGAAFEEVRAAEEAARAAAKKAKATSYENTAAFQSEIPIAVKAQDATSYGAFIEEIGQRNPQRARLFATYEKPSTQLTEIGVDPNIRIAPGINHSMSILLDAMKASRDTQGLFNGITSAAKKAYTSRNIASAMNNYKANILLYNMFYGLPEGVGAFIGSLGEGISAATGKKAPGAATAITENGKAFRRFVEKKPANTLESNIFDAIRETGIIDNTNAGAETLLTDKGGIFSDIIAKGGKPGRFVSKYLKKLNASQDAIYSFGDNYFKFLATLAELKETLGFLDVMEEGTTARVRVGERRIIDIRKNPNDTFTDVKTGKVIPETKLINGLTKGSSARAAAKFVDYRRIPGYLAWLRSGKGGIGGLVSLFLTWQHKMADIPGFKKGIVSEFISNPRVIVSTDSPAANSALRWADAKRAFGRAMMNGASNAAIDKGSPEELARLAAWNKNKMAPIIVSATEVDPWAVVYNDQSAANFLGPTEQLFRVGLAGTIGAAKLVNKMANYLGVTEKDLLMDLSGMAEAGDKQDKKLMRAARDIYTRYETGQLLKPSEVLETMGMRAGGPLFDIASSIIEADEDPNVDLGKRFGKIFATLIMGGTGKRVAFSILSDDKSKFRPEVHQPLLDKAVAAIFGQAWRMSYVHNYRIGKGKDYGLEGRWVDELEKYLKASLAKDLKRKLEELSQQEGPEADALYDEYYERYRYILESIAREKARLQERLRIAKDRLKIGE